MHRTPLADEHRKLGARMVDFHGWEMPVAYGSIQDEAVHVRTCAGAFDLSHMGRVFVRGEDRLAFLESIASAPVSKIRPGRVRYSLLCNDEGGVLDDILISGEEEDYFVVVNASNREKDLAWMHEKAKGMHVTIDDQTQDLVMIALQGPEAQVRLQPLTDVDLSRDALRYYRFRRGVVCGVPAIVSRTGYTGEDGFEVVADAKEGPAIWRAILAAGDDGKVRPIGLGARDTLRLEAGMPLYGNELREDWNPIEAGLGWAIKSEPPFAGRDAMRRQEAAGLGRRMVGLEVDSPRIPRTGAEIRAPEGDGGIGVVTSGTVSPNLRRTVAIAYVARDHAAPGTSVRAQVRHDFAAARVVDLPFLSRTRKTSS